MREYTEVITIDRAEVDMYCDHCGHEITIGEDYYYDQEGEEVLCEACVNE